jgi:hypothetical protein
VQYRNGGCQIPPTSRKRACLHVVKKRLVVSTSPANMWRCKCHATSGPAATVSKEPFPNIQHRVRIISYASTSKRTSHSVAKCMHVAGATVGEAHSVDKSKTRHSQPVHPGSLSVCPGTVVQRTIDCMHSRSVTVRLMLCPASERGKRHRQGLLPRKRHRLTASRINNPILYTRL